MKRNKQFMTITDVQDVLGCSHSHATTLVRRMNIELASKGYLTISGKIPTAFFAEKWYGFDER